MNNKNKNLDYNKKYGNKDRLLLSGTDYCKFPTIPLIAEIFPSKDFEVNNLVSCMTLVLSGNNINMLISLFLYVSVMGA